MTTQQQEKLITLAKNLIGTPYKYGTTPEMAPHEFDCSSFIQYLYAQIGITLPRSTILQAADPQGKEVACGESYTNLETGDLLFMRGTQGYYNDNFFPNRELYIGHVALYLGNNETIHAREIIGHVILQSLQKLVTMPKFNIVLVKRF